MQLSNSGAKTKIELARCVQGLTLGKFTMLKDLAKFKGNYQSKKMRNKNNKPKENVTQG